MNVCGMRRVGGQRRNRSGWWNEKVGGAVAEKKRAGYRIVNWGKKKTFADLLPDYYDFKIQVLSAHKIDGGLYAYSVKEFELMHLLEC